MRYLQIEDLATGETQLATPEEAAAIINVDRYEIEWAIEEFGICTTLDHAVVDSRVADEIAAA